MEVGDMAKELHRCSVCNCRLRKPKSSLVKDGQILYFCQGSSCLWEMKAIEAERGEK